MIKIEIPSLSELLHDTRVRILLFLVGFASVASVLILILLDIRHDKEALKKQANRYETFIDQQLIKYYTWEELTDMSDDELRVVIDRVIEKEAETLLAVPDINDFIIPAKEDTYSTGFELIRKVRPRWSDEEIKTFWKPLEDVGLDKLDEKNMNLLKGKLEGVM